MAAHPRRKRPPRRGAVERTKTGRPQQVGNPASDPLAAIAYWRDRLGDPLFVYFIQSGNDGAVKIGQAANPIKRLAELQCGNPLPLRLRAVVLAGHDLEESLHYLWHGWRVGGEWFGGGVETRLVDLALAAMRQQIGTKQNDLYEASTTLVVQTVHPGRLIA